MAAQQELHNVSEHSHTHETQILFFVYTHSVMEKGCKTHLSPAGGHVTHHNLSTSEHDGGVAASTE